MSQQAESSPTVSLQQTSVQEYLGELMRHIKPYLDHASSANGQHQKTLETSMAQIVALLEKIELNTRPRQ